MIYITLLLVALMTAGHFVYGHLFYLKDAHNSIRSELTSKTTDAVFHYNSVMFILTLSYILFVALKLLEIDRGLIIFLSFWFIGAGIVNMYIALRSNIGLFKMFQWALFFLTGLCLLVTI